MHAKAIRVFLFCLNDDPLDAHALPARCADARSLPDDKDQQTADRQIRCIASLGDVLGEAQLAVPVHVYSTIRTRPATPE